MHIPDGFLSPAILAATGAASAGGVYWMSRRAQGEIEESRAPLLGVMGAFVFAAQMINFPVGAGTTGHLLGGALLAFTLGPAPAVVTMTAILAVQALVFQDGGVLALGANVFNMAIAGVLGGYLLYRLLGGSRSRGIAVFTGASASVMVCAVLALAELRLSGVPMPPALLGVSMGLFAVNAVLEGAVTVGVIQALARLNPGFVKESAAPLRRPVLAAVALAAVFLASVGVWFASEAPDGLESLADKLGIGGRARAILAAPLPGYDAAWFGNAAVNKAVAGVLGAGLAFAAVLLLGRILFRKKAA
ncbi:MAG: energy-coupling factor ABC transporter permease [Bryobacterales bacterium]|nr:energy-coupling factor ABC transporter permease [Bryobacterales bacterium]